MTIEIRPECSIDASAIDSVNRAAFGREDEAMLVRRLRADGALVLSLVAEQDRTVIGHVAFSRLIVEHGYRRSDAVSLAPLAVVPTMQGKGIGTALIRRGLADLAGQGEALVFVLGEPAYYTGSVSMLPRRRRFRPNMRVPISNCFGCLRKAQPRAPCTILPPLLP